MLRMAPDDPAVVSNVATATHLSYDDASQWIRQLRFSINELFADDFTVVALPLVLARTGDPVLEAALNWARGPGRDSKVSLEDLPLHDFDRARRACGMLSSLNTSAG